VKPSDILLAPHGDGFALLLNFGLLWPRAGAVGFDLICEEAYASKSPDHALLLDDGTVFVPTFTGLRRGATGDGCNFDFVQGIPRDAVVLQIIAEPQTPSNLLALTTNGDRARLLYRSMDGGLSFKLVHTFKPNVVFRNIFIAPSDPKIVYVSGYGLEGPFALGKSSDSGTNFDIQDPLPALSNALQGVEMRAVSPTDPKLLFFARATATGPDEVWRSKDEGASVDHVLSLEESEIVTGFTYGDNAQTIFVSGYRMLETTGIPPAHLFVSKNGGDTWQPGLPSGPKGPRFQCLRYRNGTLWACGGDPAMGDAFLVGRSDDEGKTWSPVTAMPQVSPVKSCVSALCPATNAWLCSAYGLCNEDAGMPFDGGTDAGAATTGPSGCSCRVGSRHGGGGCWGLVLGLGAMLRRRKLRTRVRLLWGLLLAHNAR